MRELFSNVQFAKPFFFWLLLALPLLWFRLRDQRFYKRSLIESNTEAPITTDPAGIISDANKQMEGAYRLAASRKRQFSRR